MQKHDIITKQDLTNIAHSIKDKSYWLKESEDHSKRQIGFAMDEIADSILDSLEGEETNG